MYVFVGSILLSKASCFQVVVNGKWWIIRFIMELESVRWYFDLIEPSVLVFYGWVNAYVKLYQRLTCTYYGGWYTIIN